MSSALSEEAADAGGTPVCKRCEVPVAVGPAAQTICSKLASCLEEALELGDCAQNVIDQVAFGFVRVEDAVACAECYSNVTCEELARTNV